MIIGLYLPVTYPLARKFPSRAPHDSSAPHVTLFYGITPESETHSQQLLQEFKSVVCRYRPFEITANTPGEFWNQEGEKITYLKPEFGESVPRLRQDLVDVCLSHDLDFSFRDQPWLPHVTWSYGECPRPPCAMGTWTVPYVGVWYAGESTGQERIFLRG